jgi:hypothetical protein
MKDLIDMLFKSLLVSALNFEAEGGRTVSIITPVDPGNVKNPFQNDNPLKASPMITFRP